MGPGWDIDHRFIPEPGIVIKGIEFAIFLNIIYSLFPQNPRGVSIEAHGVREIRGGYNGSLSEERRSGFWVTKITDVH